jgi:hypothetical protein
MSQPDDTSIRPAPDRDDRVGLGRVVEDRRPPSREVRRTGEPAADDGDNGVQEASEESFPASDPTTFRPDRATPRDR